MKTITMAVDCGKDETKISILNENGEVVHDKFKTRMEKETAINSNRFRDSSIHTVTYEGKSYIIGSESDKVSLSNSKEELVHKIITLTAVGMHVENGDIVNIAIGCPISEYRNDEKRKKYRDFILPQEGNRVEITIDGKKKYFTIGKRAVMSECLCTLYLFPEKFRQGLTGIIDIGGLNVNGSFYTNGHVDAERCFTLKCGKNIVINELKQKFEEEFDGTFTRKDTEVFIDMGYVHGYEDESKKMIDEMLDAQLQSIKEACVSNGWNTNTCSFIFIGGGSCMLGNRIKDVFGKNVFIAKDAGYANSDGYLSLLKAVVNKGDN